jgi:hypothetical protein
MRRPSNAEPVGRPLPESMTFIGLPYNLGEDHMTKTQSFFCRSLATICLALSANAAGAQTLNWTAPKEYDAGGQTALAAHSAGLDLEAHQSGSPGLDLWYRFGSLNGGHEGWGKSQKLPQSGSWPNVAISAEGYVILIYSSGRDKSDSELNYAIGSMNAHGGTNQSITWLTSSSHRFDSGFHSSTAINGNGVIVEVHESGSGGTGLYYRVGHLEHPTGGEPRIEWDSGTNGVRYDDGINPHIAINNNNEVVEVHQVTREHYVHYRRGSVSGGTVFFGASARYDNHSYAPAVALLDNGLVTELHRGSGYYISARTGILDPNSPDMVIWFDAKVINEGSIGNADNPAVASNGSYALGTWTSHESESGYLFSSVGTEQRQSQELFESEGEFPARVRPRPAHGKAKERSIALQKTVPSKSKSPIRASPGETHGKAKERSTAPQKTVPSKSESPGRVSPGETHGKAKERSTAPQKAVPSKLESPGSGSRARNHGKTNDRGKGSASVL